MSQSVRRLATEKNFLGVQFERAVRLDAKVDSYAALATLDDRSVYDDPHVIDVGILVRDDRTEAIVLRRGRRPRQQRQAQQERQ